VTSVLRRLFLWSLIGAAANALDTASAADVEKPSPIVGIDHVSLAVRDLETASAAYRALGFVLKEGRPHTNGIRNAHIKFADGSGLELITATRPTDALASRYVRSIEEGDGAAYLALHARNTEALLTALRTAGLAYTHRDGLVTLQDPALHYIFFLRDNRSPSDTPEHFAHPNTAYAISAIWLAPDEPAAIERLLAILGASSTTETVFIPEPVEATTFRVDNGKIVLLPKSRQLLESRPIVGATFEVTRIDDAVCRRVPSCGASSSRRSVMLAPGATHGIWLELRAVSR
jgi:catechol 2,3-dioxygenase-like lactoylglutathione lyase family enzyme